MGKWPVMVKEGLKLECFSNNDYCHSDCFENVLKNETTVLNSETVIIPKILKKKLS